MVPQPSGRNARSSSSRKITQKRIGSFGSRNPHAHALSTGRRWSARALWID
jgi:hypothetical protein